MNPISISVVVPVYNEGKNVHVFLKLLKRKLEGVQNDFEIIVVDDGSTDESFAQASQVADIQIIQHHNNRGYGAALKTGILKAQYDHIMIIDADGTYPLEHIADLVNKAGENDMVVGARNGARVFHSRFKRFAKWPIHQLANYLVQYKIPDLNSGLRIFKKDLAKQFFRLLPNGFSFTTNITLAMLSEGYRVTYIPINYEKRSGSSKVRPLRDGLNYFILVVRMILFYNPLKIFVPFAGLFFILSLLSFGYDIFILDNLTEKSLILFVAFVQIVIFGFLADLINKRGHE